MPRVNVVKHARKPQGECKCGVEIRKGDPYRWWKFRYGGRHVRCMKPECNPRQSELTSSDKLSRIYGTEEAVSDAMQRARAAFDNAEDITADLTSALEDLKHELEAGASEIEDVGSEYSESASNVGEYFSGSEQESNLEDAASQCETWSSSLSDAAGTHEDIDSGEDEVGGPELDVDAAVEDLRHVDDIETALEAFIYFIAEEWDRWFEEICQPSIESFLDQAEDALNEVPDPSF